MEGRRILTVAEAADYLRVSRITVYRLLASRRLPGFKVGAAWRLDREQIERWSARNQQQERELLPAEQ